MLDKTFDLRIVSKNSYGSDSIEEIARRAELLGLDTICIADKIDSTEQFQKIKQEIGSIKTEVGILQGVEIHAKNPDELRRTVDKFRDLADVIIVAGGDLDINRAACENPKVDILSAPEKHRKDSGLDHVMAKLAADNKVAIELCFRDYLHAYKKIRTYVLTHLRKNVLLCNEFGAPMIITSGAENRWDMRAARELATLGIACGLDREKAVKAVTETPNWLVERVKKIKSETHIAPGVEIVEGAANE